MKIVRIEAQNFLSYEQLNLPIHSGVHLITGHNFDDNTDNGAGKTAIIDVISFALFGELPRRIKVDEVIRIGSKQVSMSRVTLKDGDVTYMVTRTRNPNRLEFQVNGDAVHGKDLKETQQLIERTLGITFHIFINSVYFYQSAKSHFVSATDNEKKQILTDLLNLTIFDDAYTLTSKKVKKIDQDLLSIENKIQQAQAQISSNDIDIKTYENRSQHFQENKQERISKKREQDMAHQQELINLNTRIQEAEECIKEEKGYQEKLEKVEKKLRIIDQVKTDIAGLNQKKSQKQGKHTQLQVYLNKFTDLIAQSKCPTCYQHIDKTAIKNQSEAQEREIATVSHDIMNIDGEIGELSELITLGQDFPEMRDQYTEALRDINQLKSKISEHKQLQTQCVNKQAQILKEIEEIEKEKDCFQDMIKTKQEANLKLETIKNENQGQSKIKNDEKVQYLFLKDLYRNIKYYIFEAVTQELNSRVNQYIQTLFDTDVRVKFDTETTTQKGDIKQKFSTVLIKDDSERNFNSLSGGEKRRIEVATNFALSDIISNRSTKTFQFMLLDECFEGLDREGRNRIVELLDILRQERENIFIIDHFESMRSLVDSEIIVEKHAGVSSLKEAA